MDPIEQIKESHIHSLQEIVELKAKIAKLDERNHNMKNLLAHCSEEKHEYMARLVEKKQEIGDLNSELHGVEDLVIELRKENKKLKKELEDLKSSSEEAS
ncbi:hypothetical protein KFE98_17775 [bacterium SCSIO 12741]|nr:hypothetical protein KFE98_17775 [bacterium SCSIO 12741]